jgi:hypothetical protein
MSKQVYLVTSGDLRQPANQVCWPAQAELEARLEQAFAKEGATLKRAFAYNDVLKHGFISSQRQGMDIFATIPADAPLLFATAAWQYTHHVLPGLRTHRGPILTAANWSGQWPGLVGLLNLNGSLVKAGVKFSSIWSETFTDAFSLEALREWLKTGTVTHDLSHVHALDTSAISSGDRDLGIKLGSELRSRKAILGVFDEGCMGMYNAIIDDEQMNRSGFYKERLSQSALYAAMQRVSLEEAQKVRGWMDAKKLKFNTGTDETTELTDRQILEQCRMYIAATRIAKEFGCDAIGIQYQQGLKDLVPASDLVEGLLNNPDRPPIWSADGSEELFAGDALPHFNEVDECAGVDAVITNRCWRALGLDPSTTLHDVRWGRQFGDDFVWVWQISGAAPASHFVGGYAGSESDRQPGMYFPLGGGTLKGIGRPGNVVWSRVFVEGGRLHIDMGLAEVVTLPEAETQERWAAVTSQWPLVSVVTEGVTRDQFMARHRANHVSIAYASDRAEAMRALAVKASMCSELGIEVHLCGVMLS